MHELEIARQMLTVALKQAEEQHASRITQFNIELSATADESEESLRFYFEMLTRGAAAEGARIEIVHVPVHAKCMECGNEFDWRVQDAVTCPRCCGAHVSISLADDFKLAGIDLSE